MAIRRVTDLRTGLIHPRREWDGRFMSRKGSSQRTAQRSRILDAEMSDIFDRTLSAEDRDNGAFFYGTFVQRWNAQAVK